MQMLVNIGLLCIIQTEICIKKLKDKKSEKKLGCEFIRINPDTKDHNEYVEFGKIINYINKSNENLTKESTRNFLIDNLTKILPKIKFKSNHSIKSRALKYVNKVILPTLWNMQTYCLGCKKHSNNIGSKK